MRSPAEATPWQRAQGKGQKAQPLRRGVVWWATRERWARPRPQLASFPPPPVTRWQGEQRASRSFCPIEAVVLGIRPRGWLRFAVTSCSKAVELNEILSGGISLLPSVLLLARGRVQPGRPALRVQTPAPSHVPPDLRPPEVPVWPGSALGEKSSTNAVWCGWAEGESAGQPRALHVSQLRG